MLANGPTEYRTCPPMHVFGSSAWKLAQLLWKKFWFPGPLNENWMWYEFPATNWSGSNANGINSRPEVVIVRAPARTISIG